MVSLVGNIRRQHDGNFRFAEDKARNKTIFVVEAFWILFSFVSSRNICIITNRLMTVNKVRKLFVIPFFTCSQLHRYNVSLKCICREHGENGIYEEFSRYVLLAKCKFGCVKKLFFFSFSDCRTLRTFTYITWSCCMVMFWLDKCEIFPLFGYFIITCRKYLVICFYIFLHATQDKSLVFGIFGGIPHIHFQGLWKSYLHKVFMWHPIHFY